MGRLFNFIFGLCSLIILLPLLACIALFIRLRMGSPVIYRQMRPGLYGKLFSMFKFRTMTDQRDKNDCLLPDYQRLTKLGKFLRSTSLDELPELWNVIKGDMNLVGPRPLLMEYLSLYTPEQARRHEVKPGITGWAQVNGRNAISWEEKFKCDVWYVDNASFSLDCKILWLSIFIIFNRQNIHTKGHATASKFQGSHHEHYE